MCFYDVLLYWLSTRKFMRGPRVEDIILSRNRGSAWYADCRSTNDKASLFSKGYPSPKLLHFLQSCGKNLEITLKSSKLQTLNLFACSAYAKHQFSSELQMLEMHAK